MQLQDVGQYIAHLTALHDAVHEAVVLEILGTLEALRELAVDGLLDNTWSGEADQCARLCEGDVPEGREARRAR